ncbi:hypothetical protein BGZ96_004139 [Linnemannia gamsii]|uniref:Uncharacterized protein n=1 Tax=Linnemannia gamsii TaxID=64522 RepID=A0ABQ7JIM8_9FUNG|nr:hypothetical protein BGZ96_004139 [Linnemannia gamsii]
MVGLDSILGYVGFVSTLLGWFPSNPDKAEVRVKFWAGRDGFEGPNAPPLWSAGGDLPKIDVRSTANKWIGKTENNLWIDSNALLQTDVKLSGNEEINYLTLTSDRTDASCLALIGWTPNDSSPKGDKRKGYIIGDLFRLCGFAWNHSGQTVEVASTGIEEYVNCGWMVRDRAGFAGQLNINLDVMGEGYIKNYKGKDLCYWGVTLRSGKSGRPSERSLSSSDGHLAAFGNQVRVHKSLSAIDLCDSPTSWGSSFFSIEEGVFCDMSTKTKIPLCKAGETKGCFVYEKPIENGRGGYSTKRNVGVRGSTVRYNATYLVTSDQNGRVIDDGRGY